MRLKSPVSGKQFFVYPLLFGSGVECEVALNWEHSHVAWVEPSRLRDADCVDWQHDVVMALLTPS